MLDRRHIEPWKAILTFVLLCCVIAAAQSPAKSGQHSKRDGKSFQPSLQLSSQVELVLVPVVVADKSGAHVPHLSQDDFEILEGRRPRRIATFEEVTSSAQRPRRMQSKTEFSNRFDTQQSTPRITIIAVDLINTLALNQATLRSDLLRFLTQSPYASGPMALVALTRNGLRTVHDITADPGVLAIALSRMNAAQRTIAEPVTGAAGIEEIIGGAAGESSASAGAERAMYAMYEEIEHEASLNHAAFEQRLAAVATLQALRQIADAYGGLPGRKSLIWMTGGFPFAVSDSMVVSPFRDVPSFSTPPPLLSAGRDSPYENSLQLAPGDYKVRFVVRDGLSGRIAQ